MQEKATVTKLIWQLLAIL